MTSDNSYSSIAVIELLDSGEVVIEALSVTPESCELTGAWLVQIHSRNDLFNILHGRLILLASDSTKLMEILKDHLDFQISIQDFIAEAKRDAKAAKTAFQEYVLQNEESYAKYMSVKPTERKLLPKVLKRNLVEPEFYEWPSEIDRSEPQKFLKSLGRLGAILGTDPKFNNVLAISRIVKYLIDMWRSDEIERKNRLYVTDEDANISILPNSWLSKSRN